MTRYLLGAGVVGTVGTLGWLGREWESEEEKMKLCGRSEDQQAVLEAEEGGLMGWFGRGKLRGADYLDVSASLEVRLSPRLRTWCTDQALSKLSSTSTSPLGTLSSPPLSLNLIIAPTPSSSTSMTCSYTRAGM